MAARLKPARLSSDVIGSRIEGGISGDVVAMEYGQIAILAGLISTPEAVDAPFGFQPPQNMATHAGAISARITAEPVLYPTQMMSNALSHPRRHRYALIGLLSVAALILCLRQLSDPDIWFHLVIGRQIATLGAIPAKEFYIFGALSEAAHYPAAGFDLLQYCLFRMGGWGAMALFNAVTFIATLGLLYRAARISPPPGPVATAGIVALGVVFIGLNLRFVYRPEEVLYFLLGLELLILERWLCQGKRRTLWLLPLLSWFIIQIHTTWILLLLVFGAYAVHRLQDLATTPGKSWMSLGQEALLVLLVALLMAVLPLANPYGQAQLQVLLPAALQSTSLDSTTLAQGSGLTHLFASIFGQSSNGLVEYLPIYQTEYGPYFLLIAAAVILASVAARRLRTCDLLMVLGLGSLAVSNARNIGLFALACAIPLTHALTVLLKRLGSPLPIKVDVSARILAGTMAVVGTTVPGNWGFGPKPGDMPETGAQVVRSQMAGGNVFNFFHLGGYLAWQLGPDFKVAMDGHFVKPTAADGLHDRFFRADSDWRWIAQRFSIGAIVTPATLPYSGQLIPLVRELARDPAWRLVAAEEAGLTFLRESPFLTAPPLPKTAIWQQALRETDAILKTYPDQSGALESRAMARTYLVSQGVAP